MGGPCCEWNMNGECSSLVCMFKTVNEDFLVPLILPPAVVQCGVDVHFENGIQILSFWDAHY